MAKIQYSQLAHRDLEKIGDYIAEDLKNPIAALNTVNRIQDTIDRLADFPESGAPLSSHYKAAGDYRFLVCGNYLAFYRVADNTVFIDRILYGRQDYMKILFGNMLEDDTGEQMVDGDTCSAFRD